MNRLMVIAAIGELSFTDIVAGLQNEFFKLSLPTQEALWKAVFTEIDEGTTDIHKLISFARFWLDLYLEVKLSVHRGISKL